MANITSYPAISSLASEDLIVVSDASTTNNATRTTTVGSLANFIGSTETLGYKSYVCLLNQTGTSAPVPTVISNSLAIQTSSNPWKYNSPGSYTLSAPGIIPTFVTDKTIVFTTGLGLLGGGSWSIISGTELSLATGSGDVFSNVSFEVRVYA